MWLLGWVSFLTDTASEAIYPLLPLFLTRVLGAGAMSLGIIEGVAEAANSILKIASGALSDRWRVQRPIVIAGYGLSSSVRPLISLVQSWHHVLFLRFTDRLGKGIRTPPRDVLLAEYSERNSRGRIYGFHRGMDHAGAVVGPLLASLFLLAYPEQYRALFALTAIPGALAVLLLFFVPEVRGHTSSAAQAAAKPTLERRAWRALPRRFHLLLGVILVFTLGNSTDAFLLLRLSQVGVATAWIPLLWAALHIVKAASSVRGGALSDRLGRRTVIGSGWIVYALVYGGFAIADSASAVVALFLFYGLFFGLTEGPEKALVADLAPSHLRGTAFGLYNAAIGIGSLAASVVFGFIWTVVGPAAAFGTGALLAFLATMLLVVAVKE